MKNASEVAGRRKPGYVDNILLLYERFDVWSQPCLGKCSTFFLCKHSAAACRSFNERTVSLVVSLYVESCPVFQV